MSTSKTGRWQPATILGLADTFPVAEWQSQLQVIARNLPEIGIKVGSEKLPFFGAVSLSHVVLTQKWKSCSGVGLCVGLVWGPQGPWEDHRRNRACLHTRLWSLYIRGMVNAKKCRQWFLPTSGVPTCWVKWGSPHCRLLWRLSIPHVVHTQLHETAPLELFYEGIVGN